MAVKKISELEAAVDVTASDLIQLVDVEDADMALSGTNKKVTAQLLANELGQLASVTATGSSASRKIVDRFADVVNVKDFGAVGDGVTDDTVAIQNAVNSGRSVYFPPGTYYVTSSINIYENSILRGDGFQSQTSKIRLADGIAFVGTSNFNVRVDFTECRNVLFAGLGFYGNGASVATQTGNSPFYYVEWKIENCWFGWSLKDCFRVRFLTSNLINNRFGQSDGLAKNTFHSHVVMEGTTTPYFTEINNVSFNGNRFDNAVVNTIYASTGYNIECNGNIFQANACPIYIKGISNALFVENYWESNTATTIIDASTDSALRYCSLTLNNNYIRNLAGVASIVNISGGASGSNLTNASFSSNYIKIDTTPFYLTVSSSGNDENIGYSVDNFARDTYSGTRATNYTSGVVHQTVHSENAQIETPINKGLQIKGATATTSIKNWSSRSDINGLVGGTNSGSLIESVTNAQCIIGLTVNDREDTFAIVSNKGGAAAGTYDTLVFQAFSDGAIKIKTPSDYADDTAAAAGGVPIGGIYRNGSIIKVRVS